MYLSEVYGQGGIYAKVVAASIANDIPIYTIETKAPKFIDAEFEKHRMLSSNSSSSRAIPFKDLDDVYLPFDIRESQKGMQGKNRISSILASVFRKDMHNKYKQMFEWISANYASIIHKQHLNRYLEPWMFQKKVVTATEWDNFFKLRLSPDAQPEIQELAKCMKIAMENVDPVPLKKGEWHLPYVSSDDIDYSDFKGFINGEQLKIKCSVARCARVSYNNHDNSSPDIDKDLALYETLLSSGHMTPFEHQATPMSDDMISEVYHFGEWPAGYTHVSRDGNQWSGNFKGFLQYRQLVSKWNG